MHILFFTDNFPPETNAAALRTLAHTREWVKMGHSVTILTGTPNFPSGIVFNGYKNKLYQHEVMEGIKIVRVWSYIAPNAGTVRRMIDFASLMITAAIAGLFIKKPDLVIATTPQLMISLSGWAVARLRRCPFVLELRDLWPESMVAVDISLGKVLHKSLEWVAGFIYKRADIIISVTKSFKQNLIARGIQADKIHVITNGANLNSSIPLQIPQEVRKIHRIPDGSFLVGYVGTIGLSHGLETIIDAANQTIHDPSIHYVLMGDGADKVQLIEKSHDLSNITFVDRGPHQNAIDLVNTLDIALVLLRDDPLFDTVIPSKLFEAMALGKPVILAARGESLDIVNTHQCGIGIRPENIVDLLTAIRELQADRVTCARMGANGQRAVEGNYNRVALARSMMEILQEIRL